MLTTGEYLQNRNGLEKGVCTVFSLVKGVCTVFSLVKGVFTVFSIV